MVKRFLKWPLLGLVLCGVFLVIFFTRPMHGHDAGQNSDFFGNDTSNINENEVNKDTKPEVTVSSVKQVTLVAAGDDLMHIEIIRDSKVSGDRGYDFTPIYEGIKDIISTSDIAFINQETVLGGSQLGLSGYPAFNSPQELGRDLIKVGFNVVNQATNHAMDKGIKGINNTLEFWKNQPSITTMGIYESQEDRDKIRVVDKKGIKVAFLSYTYGTNGIAVPEDKPYAVNLIDKNLISRDVENARKVSDVIVVSMHWGKEYMQVPTDRQKELASFLADLGVNIVIGHHPHVLEPAEWVTGKGGNRTLVAYSLGNLVSYQNEIPRLLGGILKVVIEKDDNGIISLKEPEVIPVVTHYEANARGFRIYPLEKYTDELAARHGLNRTGKKVTVEEFRKIASTVLKDWFKDGRAGNYTGE